MSLIFRVRSVWETLADSLMSAAEIFGLFMRSLEVKKSLCWGFLCWDWLPGLRGVTVLMPVIDLLV